MKSRAFTLIELLVYLTLFSFFTLLSFGFLNEINIKVFLSIKKNEKIVRTNIALDLLRRDLMCASSNIHDWDQSYWGQQELIFRKKVLNKNGEKESRCISWKIIKGNLTRIDGEYDFVTRKWVKRNFSKVGGDFEKLTFNLHCDKQSRLVDRVDFELLDGELIPVAQQNTIRLRNGLV